MGEHNLLNPGFVGPLVNIHTGDRFYFPNFRASGGQLAGLPSLSYPRRDNVCSLPWNPSESCNGYPQSYFSSPVSINPSFNRSCEITRLEESKCYYGNSSNTREPCSESNNLKREERARDTSVSSDHGMHNGMGNSGTFSKYDYGTEHLTQDPPSCQSLESDSSSSVLNEGGKTSAGDPQTLISQGNHASNIASGGGLFLAFNHNWNRQQKHIVQMFCKCFALFIYFFILHGGLFRHSLATVMLFLHGSCVVVQGH